MSGFDHPSTDKSMTNTGDDPNFIPGDDTREAGIGDEDGAGDDTKLPATDLDAGATGYGRRNPGESKR